MAFANDDGYRYGLTSIEFNEVELGIIDEDSLDFGGSAPEITKIWGAQKRSAPVKSIKKNNGEIEIKFNIIELKGANLKALMGGTVDATSGKWSSPTSVVELEGAVEINTADGAVINIAKASLVAYPKGKLDYSSVLKLECTLTVLEPDTGSALEITPPQDATE